MKTLIILMISILTFNAQATVDMQTEVTILTENYHEEAGYWLRKTPADFCVGIESLTLAKAITQPVWINVNYGCGSIPTLTQINAATCAKLNAEEVSNPDGTYNPYTISIEMDLLECTMQGLGSEFESKLIEAIYATYADTDYQVTITKK